MSPLLAFLGEPEARRVELPAEHRGAARLQRELGRRVCAGGDEEEDSRPQHFSLLRVGAVLLGYVAPVASVSVPRRLRAPAGK